LQLPTLFTAVAFHLQLQMIPSFERSYANDPRRHKYEDVWNLCEDCGLHDCIYDYYSENPELGIVPEKNLPEDNEDDEENND